MPNKKISEYSAITVLVGADLLEVSQFVSGSTYTSKKITAASLVTSLNTLGLATSASVTAEATARASADTSEATTRAAADSTLTTSITTEATTRASADTALTAAYIAADAVVSAAFAAADSTNLALAVLLAGRAGGQTVKGDTASGGNLTLTSTAHATKGRVNFNAAGTIYLDETTGLFVGLSATSPTFTSPTLGTPSSGTLINCTLPASGLTGTGTGVITALGQNVTGSGSIALSASPAFTGTLAAAAANFSGAVTIAGGTAAALTTPLIITGTVSGGNELCSKAVNSSAAGVAGWRGENSSGRILDFSARGSGCGSYGVFPAGEAAAIYANVAGPLVFMIDNAAGYIAFGVGVGGAENWRVSTSGHWITGTDNSFDIGASGATRPRNLYVAGTGAFGGAVSMAALTATSATLTGQLSITLTTAQQLLRFDASNLETTTVSSIGAVTRVNTGTNAGQAFTFAGTGGLVIGSGASAITKVLSATAALNFGSVAAGTSLELDITVTGAVAGDTVMVMPSGSPEADLTWCGYAGTDKVTVRIDNSNLLSATDPASRTWRATVIKI